MHGTSFDWLTWSGGSLIDLGIQYNTYSILLHRHKIKQYAIGWCKGEAVVSRPKADRVALMFLKDDNYFWTHITLEEFNNIFKETQY
jgi:hypothetical protein